MLLPKNIQDKSGDEGRQAGVRRPAGVVVAAIVLGLMALMGAFGSLVAMIMPFLIPNPAVPQVPGIRAIMAMTTGVMLCFFLFCLWTVVGLFRMRPWARFSILAIGGLEFCFSMLMCAVMILMRNMGPGMPQPVAPSPVRYQTIFLGIGAFYGILSLIGLWWLLYFNLRPVRTAFAGAAPAPESAAIMSPAESFAAAAPAREPTPGWRIVIVVWACLMLVSILFFPMMLLMHMPLFLFGIVFRGGEAAGLLLVLIAVQLYLGVGLLKKWKPAWYVGLGWQVYTVAVFLSFLLPGEMNRFDAYQQELMSRWAYPPANLNGAPIPVMNPAAFMKPGMAFGVVAGFAMVTLLTTALMRRRGDYLHP